MSAVRQVSFFKVFPHFLMAGLALLSLTGCVVFQKTPPGKPFAYKTDIDINARMTPAAKQEMISGLQNQLDDSLKIRVVSYAGLVKVVKRPPVFDTVNVSRSRSFMKALLTSQGYFYPVIRDTFVIDTAGDLQKVTVRFQVSPGLQTRFDSVGYALTDPEMQQLILAGSNRRNVQRNDPYSISRISGEIDRMLQQLHNSGYYKMNREDIYAEVDTVIAALIDPTLDPFEQIRLLDSLSKKKDKPTINVVFKQRVPKDSMHHKLFSIGNVTIYPDQSIFQDSLPDYTDTTIGRYRILSTSDRFKNSFLVRNTKLTPGKRYSESDYFRTINTFNRLGAWQNVDVTLRQRDSLPILDADILLYPAMKRNIKIDLEASRNIADYLTTSQFFGLGLNFSLNNRNAFRESIQTNTNARFGVEFGSTFIQTLQSNLSHTIYFPRLITPFGIKPGKDTNIVNERTILNLNGAYTVRREIYDVISLNTSWGYEWTSRKLTYQFIPLNIEYTKLNGKDSLQKLIADIPSLKFAFNDGFVIGIIGGVSTSWGTPRKFSNFKIRMEESGALFGFITKLERNNLFRFIKTDVEYKHFINYKKSAFAFRLFAGYGFVYGRKGDQPERILPFFKAYFAGGPYSMRAWQVRRLGPGSSILYDTTNNGSADRFGNMQLEANIEYRFDLTTVAGIKVKSALFADIGNVWGVEFSDQAATQRIPEASFQFNRLYRDLAVAGGTSLRFDFDFFLIRLDWAYKIKNPRYADINSGWFHKLSLNNGQFQLGINYPF